MSEVTGADRRKSSSPRMREFDYTTSAAYFVTVCVEGRWSLLGEVVDGEMRASIAGLMVESWWGNIERRFPSVLLGPHVVMPNHLHGIVMLGDVPASEQSGGGDGEHIGSPLHTPSVVLVGEVLRNLPVQGQTGGTETTPSLSEVVQWFKTMTTSDYIRGVKQYGFPAFRARLWQRSFHDHIIRNDTDYQRIIEYIAANPAGWNSDTNYE